MTDTAPNLGTDEYFDAGGVRAHPHEAGTGDPVIMLHGSGIERSGEFNATVADFLARGA